MQLGNHLVDRIAFLLQCETPLWDQARRLSHSGWKYSREEGHSSQ